ncbi:MAG: diamine N-acetyltransferase [Flavobacteriales bacterium]|jgi:diamine N-acetyltransferase
MLTGKKIKLRALEPTDLSLLYDWENRTEFWDVSQTTQAFSKHMLEQYLSNQHVDVLQSGQLRMMIEEDGRPVGTVELFDVDAYHQRAGVGVMIADLEDRNKGFALEALEIMARYSFHYLHLHQLYCNIASDNLASIQLFTKAGYDLIGVKKEWVRGNKSFMDLHLFQLISE